MATVKTVLKATRLVGVGGIALFLTVACGDKKPTEREDAPKISEPAPRAAKMELLPVQVPDGHGAYFELGPKDFVNGNFNQDLNVDVAPAGFDPTSDELLAIANSIFVSGPGLMWVSDPPFPVTITLKARGRSQTVNRKPHEGNGRIAVSLYAFSDVYPPAYRERYELTIQSIPGAVNPFTYTYTFAAARSSVKPVYAMVVAGDGAAGIRFGKDNPNYVLAKITTSEKCEACTIEVSAAKSSAAVKRFTELPVIPLPGPLRITFPKRYSGMIVESESRSMQIQIFGNNTSVVQLIVPVPADMTQVTPWCSKHGNVAQGCPIRNKGQVVPSYFRFLNAIPFDDTEKSFGGVEGVASASIGGSADVIVRRDGNEVERKTVSFDSGIATVLDVPSLPSWALDEVRRMLTSGAPEFAK